MLGPMRDSVDIVATGSPEPDDMPRARFWLRGFEVDLRSLAVFRVGLGALILLDLLDRSRDFSAMYTDDGLLDAEARVRLYGPLVRLWPHHWLAGSAPAQATLFALHAVAAAMLLIGWRTRVATVVSWFLAVSLSNVNRAILGGGDVLLTLLLFWSMFLPLGARWSVDARRDPALRAMPNALLAWPGAALLFQIAFIYLFTAVLKLTGGTWRDGTAFGVVLQNRFYLRSLGTALPATPGFSAAITYATLVLEAVGPLLLVSPWSRGPVRMALVLAFVAFHLAIELTMQVVILSWASCAAWLAMIPGWAWDRGGADPPPTSPVSPPALAPRLRDAAVGAALVVVLLINLCQLPWTWARWFTPPGPVLLAARVLDLLQRWTLFAPNPRPDYWWWVLRGTTEAGDRIDILHGGRPVRYDEPVLVSAEFPSRRWLAWYMNLAAAEREHVGRLGPLARYAARRWNAANPDQSLATLRIEGVRRAIGSPPDPPVRFYEYDVRTNSEVYSVSPALPGFP